MNIKPITLDQFTDLAQEAEVETSINLPSMAILKSEDEIIIQSASGEYLLITE